MGYFEKIFIDQGYTEEELEVVLMMFGRLLAPVGYCDLWQIYGYMLGPSQCGKSSTMQALTEFYPFEDVGVFSSETSKHFALDKLFSKMLIVAPEMDQNLAVNKTTLQSIISGTDSMTITGKFKADKFIKNWTVPIVGAGNHPLGKFAGEAIARRTLVIDMSETTAVVDITLLDKLKSNIPSLAIKGWRLYKKWITKVGNGNIWDFLPLRFTEANLEMKKTTTPLVAFLESEKVTISDPVSEEVYCPLDQFKDAFTRFCNQNRITIPEWNKQLWYECFKKRGLKIIGRGYEGKKNIQKPWPRGRGIPMIRNPEAFVIGIDIVI